MYIRLGISGSAFPATIQRLQKLKKCHNYSQTNGEMERQTCCGICIGSRRRPQCPAGECTWIWDRVQRRGTSFAETFAY